MSHKQHNLRRYNRRCRVLSLSFEPLKIITQVGVMKPARQGVLPKHFGSRHDDGQAVDIDYQLLDMLLVFGIFVAGATRRSSMSTIDKQRIAAIRKLERSDYLRRRRLDAPGQ